MWIDPQDAIGYRTEDGDPFCLYCYRRFIKGDQDWPITTNDAGDTPTHCRRCEVLIPHDLTGDGEEYVMDRMEETFDNITRAVTYPAGGDFGGGQLYIQRQWWKQYGEKITRRFVPNTEACSFVRSAVDALVSGWPERDEHSPQQDALIATSEEK